MHLASWADLDLGQPVNWAHPLNRGRVAWWLAVPGRYGSNDWYDLSRGYNGVFNSFASPNGWNSASNPGGAGSVQFDGTTSYISLGSLNALNLPGAMTALAWVYVTSTAGNQAIVGDSNAAATLQQWLLYANYGAQNHLALIWANTLIGTSPINSVLANKWYRVGFSRSGSSGSWSWNIWINGQSAASGSTATNPSAQQGAAIGRLGLDSARYFGGRQNDISFWSRPLSAQEVLADYWLSQQGYADVLQYDQPSTATIFLPPVAPSSSPPGPASWLPWSDLDYAQPINRAHPLARGVQAWWLATPQNYGCNDWYDLSKLYTGVLTGYAPGFGWDPRGNPSAPACIKSSNTTNYVSTNYAGITGTAARTFSAWFKTTNTTAGPANCVCGYGSTATGGQWYIAVENGSIWFRGAGTTAQWGSGFNDGNWHHVAVTFPAGGTTSSLSCYVDRKALTGSFTNGTTAINTGTTFKVAIGALPGSPSYADFFIGNLNDVCFRNRVLSASEVAALYWDSQQGYPDELNWLEADAIDTLLAPQGVGVNFAAAPTPEFWIKPPVTVSGAANASALPGNASFLAPPVVVSAGAGAVAPVAELVWIAPPVNVSTGTNVSVAAPPVATVWLKPPVTISAGANVHLAPDAAAWLKPPVAPSGSAHVGLNPLALELAAPPVTARGSAQAFAWPKGWTVIAPPAIASSVGLNVALAPNTWIIVKVPLALVGGPLVPDIVFTEEARPLYFS